MAQEKILAFDTVSSVCSLSIYDGSYHNFETNSKYGHASELMPLLDRSLDSLGYTLEDMDALVVGLGPGSFTGIRIGLATALGLSLGADIELYGVNSLLSRSYGIEGDIVIPIMDARRGNIYGASYGSFKKEPFNGPFTELIEELGDRKAIFVGEGLEAFKNLALDHSFTSPAPLAQGLIQAYRDGKYEKELKPIYLREAEAQRRLEEKNANTGN